MSSRNPDRFGVCKFADASGAEFAAEPGAFYSAERQTRIGGDHGVDENHSGVQLRREEFLFFTIIRPRAGAEPEWGVVRELDRFVGIAHTEDSCNRAEHFFAVRGRFFGHVNKNSWLVEKSRALNTVAAGQ